MTDTEALFAAITAKLDLLPAMAAAIDRMTLLGRIDRLKSALPVPEDAKQID